MKFVQNAWRKKKIPLGTFRSECLRKWSTCCRDAHGKEELRTKGSKKGVLAEPSPPAPSPPPPLNLLFFTAQAPTSASTWRLSAWHDSDSLRLSARIYSHGAVTSVFQGISQVCGRPRGELLREPTRRSASGNMKNCHIHRKPVCCSTYSRPVGGTVSVLRKRQRSGCMFSFYICYMRFLKMNTFTSSSVIFCFHHSSFHMANHSLARAGFSDWLITDEIGRHWDSQQSLSKCPDYIFLTKAAAVKHQPGGTSFPDATLRTQLH